MAQERFLVLLRHGIAEERTEGKPDADRALTDAGNARMKQIARGVAKIFPKAEVIYSSPLLRCVQTSLWVAKAFHNDVPVKASEALVPGSRTKELRDLFGRLDETKIILVGHEPNLSTAMVDLTGIESGVFELKKGGCYGLRLYPDGSAKLEWMLPPPGLRRG